MNHKNLIFSIALLLLPFACCAQSYKYYVPYYADGKYGYSDTSGNVVIQPRFIYADKFNNEGYAFFYSSTAGKPSFDEHSTPHTYKGLINSEGKEIVPCKFGFISITASDIYVENYRHLYGMYTREGLLVLKDNYNSVTRSGNFAAGSDSAGYINVFHYDSKKKAYIPLMKKKGESIAFFTKNGKTNITIYYNGYASEYDTLGKLKSKYMVETMEDHVASEWDPGISETDGSSVSTDIYNDGHLHGLISRHNGTRDTFPALYSSLRMITSVENHIYLAKKNGKYGLLNGYHQTVCPFEYDSIKPYVSNGSSLNHGFNIEVCNQGYWGVLNTKKAGSPIIPCRYKSIEMMTYPYGGNAYRLKSDDLFGFAYIKDGRLSGLVEPLYMGILEATCLGNEYFLAKAWDKQNRKYWVNLKGFEYKKPD